MNGKLAMQSWWQVERGAKAKPSAKGQFFKLYFIQAACPSTVASGIYVVWLVRSPLRTYCTAIIKNMHMHINTHSRNNGVHIHVSEHSWSDG